LYAGLLLKKANPEHRIEVVERNPADATYGWGVVFSDRTLSTFREADFKTYQEITDNFVIWPAIDVYYRDEVLRCGGHSFAGLARRKLLLILQERCRELGVQLSFDTEFNDFDRLKEYDLVIAADGVNSLIRQHHAEVFKPRIEEAAAKYVWFGTDKVLDAFTFIFKESKHGLFQVHAYPFDGQTSTFIVECAEDVWRRAGLDKADEAASIDFCEDLFGDFLQGRRLLSNRSLWSNFIRIKNRVWHHDNIVLLGDSVHTAHFSIGSGTRLAMEGAIALAQAFESADDLQTAFNLYEMERRPRVEALQEAALISRTYFEEMKRYTYLDPMQFTTNLLTRSGRITYDNLRVRDPYYVDQVDRRFASSEGGRLLIATPPLFTPFKTREMTLSNRVVAAPLLPPAVDGTLSKEGIRGLSSNGQRGAGLLLVGPVAVSAEGRISPESAGLYSKNHLSAWRKVVEATQQASGARIGIQLNHAGRRGATRPRAFGLDRPLRQGAWPLLAPSPLPYHDYSQTPRAMDGEDMDRITGEFIRSVEMAQAAGFDLLQLNFGHGYLLGSFLSPLTNQRQDDYGGSLANRLRFPLELLESVRNAWPSEKPLLVAINASEWARDGLAQDDVLAIARELKKRGADLLEPLAGQTVPDTYPQYSPGFLTPYSELLRHEARLPTLVRGYLTTTGEINSILAAGRGDLCVLEIVDE